MAFPSGDAPPATRVRDPAAALLPILATKPAVHKHGLRQPGAPRLR
jgi:hypothetical protein